MGTRNLVKYLSNFQQYTCHIEMLEYSNVINAVWFSFDPSFLSSLSLNLKSTFSSCQTMDLSLPEHCSHLLQYEHCSPRLSSFQRKPSHYFFFYLAFGLNSDPNSSVINSCDHLYSERSSFSLNPEVILINHYMNGIGLYKMWVLKSPQ